MNEYSTIKIAFCGLAHGHIQQYLDVLKNEDNVLIHGIYDKQDDRQVIISNKFNTSRYESIDELLKGGVDLVIIGSETSKHLEMVKEVSRYGVNIALQKPIATTLEDAIEILKTVDRAGIRLYLLWQMRQDPQNIKIKNIIDQGVLGRVLYFRRKHCLSTHRWPDFKSSWHVKKEMNIGMWADDASHPIDLVRWYFGMPQSVYADIDTLVDCKIPDDNGIAIFRYKDGLFAEVMCSFTSDFGETTTEINGTEGCLIQYYGDAPSCNQKADHECSLKWKRYGDADWNTCPIQTPKHHTQRIRDLVPSILNFAKNNFTPPSPEEYMDTLKMTLMCYESSMIKKQLLI